MSTDEQVDPWEKIRELQAEISDLRAELRTCHDMLDGAGIANDEGMQRLTQPNDCINLRLAARLQRFILLQIGCPMRRIR